MPNSDSDRLQLARAIGYIVIVIALSLLSTFLVEGNSLRDVGQALMLVTIVSLGQSLASFGRMSLHGAFAFFLADAVVAAVLVRSTGGASSPLLVLFPMISLAVTVVLTNGLLIALVLLILLVCMVLAVGWGIAAIGHGTAIGTTAALGYYLARALTQSGVALRVSERARKRLENLQKAILTNIPSGLMSIDTDGRIIQINRVGAKILGLSEEKVLGLSMGEIWPELHVEVSKVNTLVPLPKNDSSEEGMDRRSVVYHGPKRELMKLGYSVARLKDPLEESFLGTLVVFQDLTEVLKMEENLRTSQKLAAIGQLAAGIAHEIRNPLAGISGSAQLLQGNHNLDEEDNKLLSIIQRESARLDQLIGEFLEYSKPPKLKTENMDLLEVVNNVQDNLKVNPKWRSLQCAMTVRCSSPKFMVQGEINKVTQILMNFILNAGQAGATQVEIVLENSNVIKIYDNGSGIRPEHLLRLFEPFFTTKDSGTGLGLATSYKALEAMGARVKVVSPVPDFSEKGGTMFYIQFKSAA